MVHVDFVWIKKRMAVTVCFEKPACIANVPILKKLDNLIRRLALKKYKPNIIKILTNLKDGVLPICTTAQNKDQGKYSKRRRSNVAVIHVRTVFIGSFLFYCLLLNHSFQINPNSITNCVKLFFLFTTLQLHLLNALLFDLHH